MLVALLAAASAPAPAFAATVRGYDSGPANHHARAGASPAPASPPAARASAAAPPRSRPIEPEPPVGNDDPAADDTASADPLVGNGLGGALCRNADLAGGLSAQARRNCQMSGVADAAAPVGNYGFDIHIDTGALGLSSRTLLSAVQTLLLTPLWTLLLWLTHAVLSLVEWGFAIDLLDPATMGSIAGALSAMHSAVTEPWLVALLALAAIALLYHAVVRRRIVDSVGEVAAMTAMILAGLWIIANPAGTVGEINRALNHTGLGAVAAVSSGNPGDGRAALGDGLRAVFATAVTGPWCYLEFGDVDWCRNPRRLDARLRATADNLRGAALDDAHCRAHDSACQQQSEPAREAQLLGRAQSNGDLFLAFPANSAHRNAINQHDSLYRTLCGTENDNACRGPTADVAQWRTESGTWSRAGGLVLIAAGIVGMLALLLFIALRLLGAAILIVVYLLLAPLAVLAPTIGESGRGAFRGWLTRLLGALVAKLIYALFLGVVLLTLSILDGLGSLGWWTQWLLIAAFWWIVYTHRHEVLAYARLGHAETGARGLRLAGGLLAARQLARTTGDAARPGRQLLARTARTTTRAVPATRARLVDWNAETAARRLGEQHRHARTADDAQLRRFAFAEDNARGRYHAHAPSLEADAGAIDARHRRIAHAVATARSRGDRRQVIRLLDRDRRLRAAHEGNHGLTGPGQAGQPADRGGFLDREALKRRGVPPGPRADAGSYRDYQRLAPLAALTSDRYRALAPHEQRVARLAIDRELDARRARIAARALARETSPSEERLERPRPAVRRPETEVERRRRQLGGNRERSRT
jgi:hypothetical protein